MTQEKPHGTERKRLLLGTYPLAGLYGLIGDAVLELRAPLCAQEYCTADCVWREVDFHSMSLC